MVEAEELTGRYVAVTGRRPQHLTLSDGFWLQAEFDRLVAKLDPVVGLSGMALGADTWWADSCLNAGVSLHAYVPFPGQDDRWREDDRIFYRGLLSRADQIITVCPRYDRWAFGKRNQALVDAAGVLVAAWDRKLDGGTWDCVKRAQRAGIPVILTDYRRQETVLLSGTLSPQQGQLVADPG